MGEFYCESTALFVALFSFNLHPFFLSFPFSFFLLSKGTKIPPVFALFSCAVFISRISC